jgi:ATP phosphoribosyltransferase
VALAKGALLKDSVGRFAAAGLDFSAILDPENRQLMVPSTCGGARALLVRNADVPVYVAYGQAQLGEWASMCCRSTSCRWPSWWTWASAVAA